MRAENSPLYALRAQSAPHLGSTSLTTWGALAERCSPSTSSKKAVSEKRRVRPDWFFSLRTTNLTGASVATNVCSWLDTPPSECSKTL
jgi:hypothetical protein